MRQTKREKKINDEQEIRQGPVCETIAKANRKKKRKIKIKIKRQSDHEQNKPRY